MSAKKEILIFFLIMYLVLAPVGIFILLVNVNFDVYKNIDVNKPENRELFKNEFTFSIIKDIEILNFDSVEELIKNADVDQIAYFARILVPVNKIDEIFYIGYLDKQTLTEELYDNIMKHRKNLKWLCFQFNDIDYLLFKHYVWGSSYYYLFSKPVDDTVNIYIADYWF